MNTPERLIEKDDYIVHLAERYLGGINSLNFFPTISNPFGPKPLNQRQQRKRWRQSPHLRNKR